MGNHSSGKSSFINYVLGRKVQTAGVAPTDDGRSGEIEFDNVLKFLFRKEFRSRNSYASFLLLTRRPLLLLSSFLAFTIIAPGPEDRDQDGPSLVGDPDLGFRQLRQFGPTLMHHTALKIRKDIDSNFIMVDSPGMIDAPANYSGMMMRDAAQYGSSSTTAAVSMDRGYDFTGVVRWFADRADIVCLFFDPDKPGTTGETLSILLHALSGMDHKLLIILNKADQFRKIHDFARAYGSLCWNLSKVIPRKDLPRVYTMCLPVAENKVIDNPPPGLQDLHSARDEVVAEVRKAPQRRMDNVLTHLHDSVSQLHMHATILQDIKQRWTRFYWQCRWQELGIALTGGTLTTALTMYANAIVPLQVTGSIFATTILATGGLFWYHDRQLEEWERQAKTREELSAAFQRTHARAISDGDEYTAAVWQRVRSNLQVALDQIPISQMSTVTKEDLSGLNTIIETDIPDLRRLLSPSHYGKDGVKDGSSNQ